MRTILYTLIFIAVLGGAFFITSNTGDKLNLPYAADCLQAPEIQHRASDHTLGTEHGHESSHAHHE